MARPQEIPKRPPHAKSRIPTADHPPRAKQTHCGYLLKDLVHRMLQADDGIATAVFSGSFILTQAARTRFDWAHRNAGYLRPGFE